MIENSFTETTVQECLNGLRTFRVSIRKSGKSPAYANVKLGENGLDAREVKVTIGLLQRALEIMEAL